MTNYLLAGGGTAGHVNPLLALADAIRAVGNYSELYDRHFGPQTGAAMLRGPDSVERLFECEIIDGGVSVR